MVQYIKITTCRTEHLTIVSYCFEGVYDLHHRTRSRGDALYRRRCKINRISADIKKMYIDILLYMIKLSHL